MQIFRLIALTFLCISGIHAANLVFNSDFSSGNVSFTSDYAFVAPAPGALVPPAVYTITPNMKTPVDLHSSATGYFDHTTGNASGLFMAVNGSTTSNQIVWEQQIPVLSSGTDYFFSAWVSSWVGGSPAQLQFSINGNLLGAPFSAPSGTAVWEVFEAAWNSGANTSATISIVNLNTAFGGNDFGLDDIALDVKSATIPEPGTLLLVSLGGAVALLLRRRTAKG